MRTTGMQVVSGVEMVYGGALVERGEVFALQGLANDEKLLEHHYLREIGNLQPEACDCGKWFRDLGTRSAHQLKQHPQREVIEVGGPNYKRGPRNRPQEREAEPMSDRDFAARTEITA